MDKQTIALAFKKNPTFTWTIFPRLFARVHVKGCCQGDAIRAFIVAEGVDADLLGQQVLHGNLLHRYLLGLAPGEKLNF